MHSFIRKIRNQAKKKNKTIVLPEGTEERVLKATEVILREQIANIVLVGKPKTIKANAKKLKLKIIELDNLVLKASNRLSINQIFKKDGEIKFRQLEINQAKKLKNQKNVVISTGGGVVINKVILDYLKQNNGLVVFLKTDFSIIKKRLKNDSIRPLFTNLKKAKQLFLFRQPLYQHYADLTVTTDNRSINQVVITIIKNLKNI